MRIRTSTGILVEKFMAEDISLDEKEELTRRVGHDPKAKETFHQAVWMHRLLRRLAKDVKEGRRASFCGSGKVPGRRDTSRIRQRQSGKMSVP